MDYLSHLNAAQRKAVLHRGRPLLVLAGAGAGKTRVITYRILSLIKEGVAPQNILAVTFTNKAAEEMREKILNLLSLDKSLNFPVSFEEKPFISTFHSLGVRILRENHERVGLPRRFGIFDREDSLRAVKESLKKSGLDRQAGESGKILALISREKGRGNDLPGFEKEAADDYRRRNVIPVWVGYEKILQLEKSLDFDDLLLKTEKLLRRNPEILRRYRELWRHIHVDEYQDTNSLQYEIIRLLSGGGSNGVCVVGDADQNIYSWRGADIGNILNFEKDFKNPEIVILEENYRSTPVILKAANKVIEKNSLRYEKNLFTSKTGGEKIYLRQFLTEKDEAAFVAEKSRELIRSGVEPEEIAVFYRANFQSRVLEESFLRNSVPYQVLGTRFFERKEVKDILAYLDAALNPDKLSSLKRIINFPPRGIGKVTMLKVFAGEEEKLPDAAKKKMADFRNVLFKIKKAAEKLSPSKLMLFIAGISGMEGLLLNGSADDKERLFNIKELAALASKYDSLPEEEGILKLMEDAALSSETDELEGGKSAVKLMTVHSSKGLEFDYCFITGLEEDLFPVRLDEKSLGRAELEEERRLFYVALTRARKKLFLTFSATRSVFGSRGVNLPSEFLSDLPEEIIEEEKFSAPSREGKMDLIEWD